MTAPAGAVVRIYVDLVATVHTGEIIETQSGRRYRVVSVREQQRGKHAGRQHLHCVVLAPGESVGPVTGDDDGHITEPRVHRIRWYARRRRPV